MNLRWLAGCLVMLALSLVVTGCGPRWVVVRQAVPDPFIGHGQFVIEAIHFDHLLVGGKPEPEYLAGKQGEQQQSWNADKADMATRFGEALVNASAGMQFPRDASGGAFVVRPFIGFIEPGFYAFASRATEVHMTVQLLNAQGQVLDEITIRSMIGASLYNPSSGTRMRQAAEDLGRVTAKYLQSRVSP